jgi:hypothetical protein
VVAALAWLDAMGYEMRHGSSSPHSCDRTMTRTRANSTAQRPTAVGKLRIGDDWNAITIIALSQQNPLKAVAEFVENAIDAGARLVTVTRGKERGEHFLMVTDDGAGVRRDEGGVPDFRYVATHVCDSVKRRLKAAGEQGIQGEFGIGLLSFWTIGDELAMSSVGTDGHVYEMHMRKGDPSYRIVRRQSLAPESGTRLKIKPLLAGIRQLSGEKIQWYLASELRERIRSTGVRVEVVDRQARKHFTVEPRQFTGQLLHQLPAVQSVHGDVYVELYFAEPAAGNSIGLYRNGTRVLASLAELDVFDAPPWNEGYLQGIVDVPYLTLTPATRTGVILDVAYEAFVGAMAPLAAHLAALIAEQRQAEEERATQDTLRSIQRAFREAMLALPAEEYDWFDVSVRQSAPFSATSNGAPERTEAVSEAMSMDEPPLDTSEKRQRSFFEYAGPLHSVRVSPATCTLAVRASRTLQALARDARRRVVEGAVSYAWRILEGSGRLENDTAEVVTVHATEAPCLLRIGVTATQGAIICEAAALVTITDSILPELPESLEARDRSGHRHGLPGYTLEHAPGKLWRSRYDAEQNLIVVNSGHRDFIWSARGKTLKLRYLARLYAKEMVQKNFPGLPSDQLLERLIELSLYTEENLR